MRARIDGNVVLFNGLEDSWWIRASSLANRNDGLIPSEILIVIVLRYLLRSITVVGCALREIGIIIILCI